MLRAVKRIVPKVKKKRSVAWKQDERIVAKLFGTKRTPLSGGNSGITRADTRHDELFIEVKKRQSHAVFQLWLKTKELAKDEDKVPVVALRQSNSQYTLVVVEIRDLLHVQEMYIRAAVEETEED